jgi:hypothetical protein
VLSSYGSTGFANLYSPASAVVAQEEGAAHAAARLGGADVHVLRQRVQIDVQEQQAAREGTPGRAIDLRAPVLFLVI